MPGCEGLPPDVAEKVACAKVYDVMMGAFVGQAMSAVTRLGVVDYLVAHGPTTASDLAAALHLDAAALLRVCRTLVACGLFAEQLVEAAVEAPATTGERVGQHAMGLDACENSVSLVQTHRVRFAPTTMALVLGGSRVGARYNAKPIVQAFGSEDFLRFACAIEGTLQTGRPGFEVVQRRAPAAADASVEGARAPEGGMYTAFRAGGDISEQYHAAMGCLSALGDSSVVHMHDYRAYRCIVDVGGGNGALLSRIMSVAAPDARGVLFEQPHEGIREAFHSGCAQRGLSCHPAILPCAAFNELSAPLPERCVYVGGSFLDDVPRGADCYVLKRVLMDLNDKQAARVLRLCCDALAPGGRIVIVEDMVPVTNDPNYSGRIHDLVSLVTVPGLGCLVRDEELYGRLLQQCGLVLDSLSTEPRTHQSVIVAKPAL